MAITISKKLQERVTDVGHRAGAFLLINHSDMTPTQKQKAKTKWLKDHKWKWKKNEAYE